MDSGGGGRGGGGEPPPAGRCLGATELPLARRVVVWLIPQPGTRNHATGMTPDTALLRRAHQLVDHLARQALLRDPELDVLREVLRVASPRMWGPNPIPPARQ